MKFIIFFMYVPIVYSVPHTFMTTYTGLNGQAVPGTPENSAVTTLDEQQIDYYDSDIKKLIPKQDWMKEFASGDRWKKYTEIRERLQKISKRFSQSHGVHMYQRRYGCVWDDETEVSHGFDKYSYDGHRFISLDLEEGRYTARVPQAEPTVQKWNNDRKQLDFLKQYYEHECTDWLKELLHFSKATLKKTGVVTELTEPIQKNQTVDDTRGSGSSLDPSHFMYAVIIITGIPILVYLLWRNWNELKSEIYTYFKSSNNSTPSHKSSQENLNEQLLTTETKSVEGSSQPYLRSESFYKVKETSKNF